MKATIKSTLGSQITVYLLGFVASIALIISGGILLLFDSPSLVFLFFALAVLSAFLSWVSFVFRNNYITKQQIVASVSKDVSTKLKAIEKSVGRSLEVQSKEQAKEYRAHTFNMLLKLEQLRVTLDPLSAGDHDK